MNKRRGRVGDLGHGVGTTDSPGESVEEIVGMVSSPGSSRWLRHGGGGETRGSGNESRGRMEGEFRRWL